VKIVTVPNKILTTPTKPVRKFDAELKKLVSGMEETLENQRNPEGVGLSANQVGVGLSVAIIRLNFDEPITTPNLLAVVNPKIIKHSKKTAKEVEGCLSIPETTVSVKRYETVTVKAQDLQGNSIKLEPTGFLARIFQHEIDHLNGRLITDYA
jgi:peptide deformylase